MHAPVHYQWERYWAIPDTPLHEYDFLPKFYNGVPSGVFTFQQIDVVPCLILIGNPGLGKTYALNSMFQQAQSEGQLATLRNLAEFSDFASFQADIESDPAFLTWKAGQNRLSLFLDTLDLGRIENDKLEFDLARFIERLPFSRLALRIVSRSAELPLGFADRLRKFWNKPESEEKVHTFRLTQLARDDVIVACKTENIEPSAFLNSVRSVGAIPLAAQPLTLSFLIALFKEGAVLPSSRIELYEKGIEQLLREPDHQREKDHKAGQFEVRDRWDAAQRLAALSILGNRREISSVDATGNSYRFSIRDAYLKTLNDWTHPESVFLETLGTGLFNLVGKTEYGWAHRSFAEFLAAEYTKDLDLPQIKSLFINPNDPDEHVAPQLRETCCWLASLNNEVLEWIWRSEPLVLLKSPTVPLTNEQKCFLVTEYIEHYSLEFESLPNESFEHLNYPGLGEQLVVFLAKNKPSEIRNRAMQVLSLCKVPGLESDLVKMAQDADDEPTLRSSALRHLKRAGVSPEAIQELLDLALNPDTNLADVEIRSIVISIAYPKWLDTKQLFEILPIVARDEDYIIGSAYDRLVGETHFIEAIPPEQLHYALRWIAENGLLNDQHLAISLERFMTAVLRRAWDFLEDDMLLDAFARAAWKQLRGMKPIFGTEHVAAYNTSRDYAKELELQVTKRHRLISAMVNVLGQSQLETFNAHVIYMLFGRYTYGLITQADCAWLIEQALDNYQPKVAKAFAIIIERTFETWDRTAVEHLYLAADANRDSELSKIMLTYFIATPLNSESAREKRRKVEESKELEKQSRGSYPLQRNIRTVIEEAGINSVKWITLCQLLRADAYGNVHNDVWDLTKGAGWETVKSDTSLQIKILKIAANYLEEHSPYSDNDDITIRIIGRRAAMEGYRALSLLVGYDQLTDIGSDIWKKWSDAVIYNDFFLDEEFRDADTKLLQMVFQNAQSYVLNQLRKRIEFEVDMNSNVLERFRFAERQALELIELEVFGKLSIDSPAFAKLLQHLLRNNSPASSTARQLALDSVRKAIGSVDEHKILETVLEIILNPINEDGWWDVWELIASDDSRAMQLISALAERRDKPHFSHFNEDQLLRLYCRIEDLYPVKDDIDFKNGLIPPRYNVQQWRNSILNEIQERRTDQCINILEYIYLKRSYTPNIQARIFQARERVRIQSWAPANLNTILQFKADRAGRYPRTGKQLLDEICSTLEKLNMQFYSDNSKQNSLWNEQEKGDFKHAGEEAFSDAIKSWLVQSNRNLNVSREAELRNDITKKRGMRTDIIVNCNTLESTNSSVIIEVKGCWNKDVLGAMQSQLVDDYLSKSADFSHGLYLVEYVGGNKCRDSLAQFRTKLDDALKALRLPRKLDIRIFVFDASLRH